MSCGGVVQRGCVAGTINGSALTRSCSPTGRGTGFKSRQVWVRIPPGARTSGARTCCDANTGLAGAAAIHQGRSTIMLLPAPFSPTWATGRTSVRRQVDTELEGASWLLDLDLVRAAVYQHQQHSGGQALDPQ